ncbi:MAG: hypothetical protein HY681_14365 [Chloroflexi bacterium]|nr:hypothetical protein [Chloroflexota bacterium]
MKPGAIVRWGETYLTGRVKEIQGDYALVEVVPDLRLDVDARIRKFFVPGMVLRIHVSSLEDEPPVSKAA